MKLDSQRFLYLKFLLSFVFCVLLIVNLCSADCSILNSENIRDGSEGCCNYDYDNNLLNCFGPIKTIEKGTFSESKMKDLGVSKVWIHDTQIEKIDAEVFGQGITQISLYNNSSLIDIDKDVFSDIIDNLTEITIRNNVNLKNIPEGIFNGGNKVNILKLSRNQISEIPYSLFKDLSSLTTLDISTNQLTYLSEDVFKNQGKQLTVNATYNCLNKGNVNQISESVKGNFSNQRVCLVPVYDYTTEVNHPVIASVGMVGNEKLIVYKYADLLNKISNHRFIQNGEFNFDVSSLERYESFGQDEGIANFPYSNKVTAFVNWISPNVVSFEVNGGENLECDGCKNNQWKGYYDSLVNNGGEPLITKVGYTFNGWYENNTFAKRFIFDEYKIGSGKKNSDGTYDDADFTLYAKWSANKYKLFIDLNGGIGKLNNKFIEVIFDQPIGDDKLPTEKTVYKTGYTFKGISNLELLIDYTGGYVYKILGDSTGVVQWMANKYPILLDANGGEVNDKKSDNITGTYDIKTVLPVPKYLGHKFLGWFNKDVMQNSDFIYKYTTGLNLIAHWELEDYTITFDTQGGTNVFPITTGYGLAIPKVNNPTKKGHKFLGWYTQNEGGEKVNIPSNMPLNGQKLFAHWEAEKYHISFDFNGGTGDNLPKDVIFDQSIGTLPIATKTGYIFGGRKIGNVFIDAKTKYTLNKDSVAIAQWINPSKGLNDGGLGGGGGGGGSGKENMGGNINGENNDGMNDKGGISDLEDLFYADYLPIAAPNLNEEMDEYHIAHEWAYEKGLTSFENFDDARMFEDLTRAEMAKISSIFATKFYDKVPDTSAEKSYACSQYADLADVNEELQGYIIQSCELGYMGYLSNGIDYLTNFRPNDKISRAEVAIVFSRIMWGNEYAGDENHWYEKHLQAMFDQGIIHNISTPFKNEMRGDVFIMLSRVDHVQ